MIQNVKMAEFVLIIFLCLTILSWPFGLAFSVMRAIYRSFKSRQPQKSIKGEVALVTGSARGLGRLTAIALAKRGCHVAIVDVRDKLAEETAKFISDLYKVKAKAYKVDVSNFEELEILKTQITQDLGDVTILVNNAGILTLSSIENPPAREVKRMIEVNVHAVFYTTQIFLPRMKELNRGHIVNISSITALTPISSCSVYGATKSAVRHMTSALRVELMEENRNITATTVMPIILNTNQRVVQMVKPKESEIFPYLDGKIVVDALVRAMLNGDDELTVLQPMLWIYRFIEFLPVYIREKCTAVFIRIMKTKEFNDHVNNVLQLPEEHFCVS